MTDWRALVDSMVTAQRLTVAHSEGETFAYGPPRPPASEADIAGTEAVLGEALPIPLRGFLGVSDGWPAMRHVCSLLPVAAYVGEAAASLRKRADDPWPAAADRSPMATVTTADVLVVGASDTDSDTMVLLRAGHPEAGRVVWSWTQGEDAVRRARVFDDFAAFFEAQLEAEQRAALAARRAHSGRFGRWFQALADISDRARPPA